MNEEEIQQMIRTLQKRLDLATDVGRAAERLLARLGDPSNPKNRHVEASMMALRHALWLAER